MVVVVDDPGGMAGRIRIAMSVRGITNESELARRTGESRQTINRWLNGHAHTMRAASFIRLAIALDVNGVWLALGRSNMSRPLSMSPDESQMLEMFRAATPENRRLGLDLLSGLNRRVPPPTDIG